MWIRSGERKNTCKTFRALIVLASFDVQETPTPNAARPGSTERPRTKTGGGDKPATEVSAGKDDAERAAKADGDDGKINSGAESGDRDTAEEAKSEDGSDNQVSSALLKDLKICLRSAVKNPIC